MGNIVPTAAQQDNEYLYSIIKDLEDNGYYPAVQQLTPCMLHGKIFKTIPYYISKSPSDSKKVALKILYKFGVRAPANEAQVCCNFSFIGNRLGWFCLVLCVHQPRAAKYTRHT